MSNPTIKERKTKLNKLSNSLNIRFLRGCRKYTQYMVDYIDKGKSFRTKSTDLKNKNRCMDYYNGLPYGILSYSSYINLEEMIIVSAAVEKIKLKDYQRLFCLKSIKNTFSFRFFKKSKRK